MTYHFIDTINSYNLLLGRPWIYSNLIVTSIQHQYLKYVNKYGVVKTVLAKKQSFKGVKNYFTDSILHQYGQEEEANDSNEADLDPHVLQKMFL